MLNPGQTIVDTSDQPVHALSNRLQQVYPHKFGQRTLPMFCRLHLEKLLLEIHDHLIAGMVSYLFKLSITGAGVQVCLCAMMLLLEY